MSAPTGITGMTGMQGLRGLVGPPRYAYQGPPFGNTTARLNVVTPPAGTIYLTPQNFGTIYNLTGVFTTSLTVSFPFYNPTYGFGPTGTISSATGKTTYITYTTSTPVTSLGLRANALIRIVGTLNNPTNVIPSDEVRILPAPTGPTGYNFSVAATTNTTTSSSGSATVRETTAVETTNEAYPTPEQNGSFWIFKNNSSGNLVLNLSNGTATINGGPGGTLIDLPIGYRATILYSTTNGFIVL
jgi:hypothetical protein